MAYHDYRFARTMNEKPMRPDYANWWEGPEKTVTPNHVWFVSWFITILMVISFAVGYFYNV